MHKNPAHHSKHCNECFAKPFCASQNQFHNELHEIISSATHCKTLSANEILFLKNDPFQFFYFIKKGAFKKCLTHENGREQIYAFYLSGDLIGLDAFMHKKQPFSVVSLENDSIVCEIPVDKLLNFMQQNPVLYEKLMRISSEQFHHMESIPRNSDAKEKIAAFLLNIAERYHCESHHPEFFSLPMSRQDIGNYLGLTIETISRILTKLKSEGILKIQGKNIVIIDPKKLQKIAIF